MHGTHVELRKPNVQLYKNMQIVGTLPGSEMKDGVKYSRKQSAYARLYTPGHLSALRDICGDKFYVVNPTKSNYYQTVKTWDLKPEYTYYKTPEHLFALEFFRHYYKDIMGDCVADAEQICDWIDWSKSPGWPHTFYGFKSKLEIVPVISDTMFDERVGTAPIWNVSGKVEFKDIEDIHNNKIRLFQIPPYELLYSQLKFGKHISLRLMNKHWSAYGFNPYGGGFDKLARKLLSRRWRGCYDVSGWDKFLSLLPDIYRILRFECNISEHDMEEFDWMTEHVCNFLLKTQDGNVLRKTYGNASGSGTTTRDNIFGHIIIFASGLYRAFFEKNGYYPSFESVFSQLVFLYGDDNIFALDDDFSHLCDETFLAQHLNMYGLKLKFFYGGLDAELSTLSFLGATFKLIDGLYYPKYDIQRLATTMVYEKSSLTLGQHLSKAFTLMVMSRPSDEFKTFYEAYNCLVHSTEVCSSDDPTARGFAFVGLPEVASIDAFYSGAESSDMSTLVFNFLPVVGLLSEL